MVTNTMQKMKGGTMAGSNNNKWEPVLQAELAQAKARGALKRDWIKLKCSFLRSSINYRMETDEQMIFVKLIMLAEEQGPVPGLISDNDCRPMPIQEVAKRADCSLELLQTTLDKGIKDDAIYISEQHGIFVTHFRDYQFTEYDRQKPYRQKKKGSMSPEERAESMARTVADQQARRAQLLGSENKGKGES